MEILTILSLMVNDLHLSALPACGLLAIVEVLILDLMSHICNNTSVNDFFQFEGWGMKHWQHQVGKSWLVKKASKQLLSMLIG